ncbi:MAG TPA: hypothetical protein VFL42_01250 [Terriglobales bacterium]|nr:hypothetical protein [Terriglobales bacterium]
MVLPAKTGRLGDVVTWVAAILACVYFSWIGASLYRSTPVFINMYNSMGVELNTPGLFVIRAYRWFYPILFGGAAALVIAKQFFVRMWVSLATTLAITVAVDLISSGIVQMLYRPMLNLMEKLNK